MKKIILMMVIMGVMVGGGVVYATNTSSTGIPNTSSTGVAPTSGSATKLENPLKVKDIKEVIFLVVDLAVYVGTAFAVLAIIFVGFKFVWAQGKPEEIKDAQMWLLYIVVGLAILLSSKVIVTIVRNTLVDSGVVNQGVLNL